MDEEMMKRMRLNCITHFHNKYMERIVNHYNSMAQNGVNHFLYYEPGIMFLGWFTSLGPGKMRFNAKFCDQANTADNIEAALTRFYSVQNARRVLLIDEFESIVLTDQGLDIQTSPLNQVLYDSNSMLGIKITTAEIDRKDYKIINFAEGLEERIFDSD